MSFTYGDTRNALENRRSFLGGLGIDHLSLVCAKQVHANTVRCVTVRDAGRGARFYDNSFEATDAFITDAKNLPLAVFTADCLSIFLYDPVRGAIGLVHAGWRGTKDDILPRAVALMGKDFGSDPSDISAGFGPCIRQCCYEVKDDLRAFFGEGVSKRGNRYYLDLLGINKKSLLGLGVKKTNIFDAGECTFCLSKKYFSHRRESDKAGRMMSVMMLT